MAIKTIYGMTEESDTMRLIRWIEKTAPTWGLTLSRWESHPGTRGYVATYSLHKSECPRAIRGAIQEGEVMSVRLYRLEAPTRRGRAFKALQEMETYLVGLALEEKGQAMMAEEAGRAL